MGARVDAGAVVAVAAGTDARAESELAYVKRTALKQYGIDHAEGQPAILERLKLFPAGRTGIARRSTPRAMHEEMGPEEPGEDFGALWTAVTARHQAIISA